MVEQEAVAARLRAADGRWSTVRGVFRTWRDQALVTQAFMDWHHIDEAADTGQNGATSFVVTAGREDQGAGDESGVEHVLRVCAAEHGRRRRAEAISRTGEQWMADVVVVDEPWFWARKDDDVLTNDGDPRSTHGGADFVLLLRPNAVPDGFDLSATGTTETVAGRLCDLVVATPKDPAAYDETLPGAEVFDMTSGGRDFMLCVDQQTSTLMRIAKLVGGEPAEIVEYLDIAFDEPVGEGIFGPLA
ncbi:hypothetical protein [Nocardioides nematodiphilus]|uniref:hypothetical protein n=1 Tax=Nocardioides nematodiphilus TaxID=2849669 RepID=UPI001CD9FE1B|nr:hypothetical protein [Nocardioides nematodiphilus]MCA1983849.1 hypothetical protein [Nocardioides nematodiphilus]